MVNFVGYFGCAAISIVMMGMLFHALVWPTLKHRKKSVLGWVVSIVFGFGMLHSMAVKPGGKDAHQGPRRSQPQQIAEPTNPDEIAVTTNTPLWETTLTFSHEDIISGDSGNPVFLVLENDVILLHTFHYGGAGSGPFLTNLAQEMQSKMDFLSNKHNRPNEMLKCFGFSSYPKLVREVK